MDTLKKTTLVLGASENPARYSNMAVRRLREHQYPVIAIGNKPGKIDDVDIIASRPDTAKEEIDTITLYLNPANQKTYYHYILDVKPRRIIFNPGTENDELAAMAKEKGIQPVEACTLVLLGTGQY